MKKLKSIIISTIVLILSFVLPFTVSYLVTPAGSFLLTMENKYVGEDGETVYVVSLKQEEVEVDVTTGFGNEDNTDNTEDEDTGTDDNGGGTGEIDTATDITELAKLVAENFHVSYGGKAYSYRGNTANPPGSPMGWVNDPLVINYGGTEKSASSGGATYRDCSTFCSLMRYYLGMDNSYVHRNSSGLAGLTETGATTFGDMQPGDIIVLAGSHAEMCVKNDGTTVYIANCGGPSSIEKTAQQGYSYTKPASDSISTWQYAGGKVVR